MVDAIASKTQRCGTGFCHGSTFATLHVISCCFMQLVPPRIIEPAQTSISSRFSRRENLSSEKEAGHLTGIQRRRAREPIGCWSDITSSWISCRTQSSKLGGPLSHGRSASATRLWLPAAPAEAQSDPLEALRTELQRRAKYKLSSKRELSLMRRA